MAGGTITIGVNGAVTNNGTLAAQNGGTLVLNSSINNGVGSQILADTGSAVLQNGVVLNGTIKVVGGGNFRSSNSGANFLDAASLTGILDLSSATGIERVTSGLVLNGTVKHRQGQRPGAAGLTRPSRVPATSSLATTTAATG